MLLRKEKLITIEKFTLKIIAKQYEKQHLSVLKKNLEIKNRSKRISLKVFECS